MGSTLTYQNLLVCRVPINSIFGFKIRTYKKVGFGSLRYAFRASGVGHEKEPALRSTSRAASFP